MTLTFESRLWLSSVCCLIACLALGYFASNAASPWPIDTAGASFRGMATPLASIFTLSGRSLPLLGIAVLGIAITVVTRTHWKIAIAIFATQLLSQLGAEGVKRIFHRARPDAWIVHKELGFSFPSGHATTAMVFYGSWAILTWISPLRIEIKIVLCVAIAVWAIGIDWSRMALGAHYATDVIGGTLFGLAWAFALWAVLMRTMVTI
ncbi:MAG: phosphatase PAP2 family protein [Candidatus Eremiobacteraeota bacterium]|nr:phosphatase PAP2 family protein [Candidatus Eremiobacteraeota bacterium]